MFLNESLKKCFSQSTKEIGEFASIFLYRNKHSFRKDRKMLNDKIRG